jgi:hypothetical protein
MNGRAPRQELAAVPSSPAIIARHDPRQLSLLPQAEQPPQRPNSGTLAAALLSMLEQGDRLTHPDFEERTGSWRLGAYVFELRLLGWPVDAQYIAAPTPSCPDRAIALYALDAPARATTAEIL